LIVISIFPAFAYAGILSFVSNLFVGEKAVASLTADVSNSQTIHLLQAARNFDPNPAKGGGDITIVGGSALLPESGPRGTLADIEENVPSFGQISIYVVRAGDSLSQIAAMFDVSVNTIIWANNMKNSVIHEGQTLIILPITGVRHTVKNGETIDSIAKKYSADTKEIAQYNGIANGQTIAVGDEIIIPDGEMSVSAPTYSGKSKATATVKGSNAPHYEGYYTHPVSSAVKTQGLHGYNAIDLGAPVGTPVVASASGTVIVSRSTGWNGGYGIYVVIKHNNGSQTIYAHLSKHIVWAGREVVKGQVIGYVGSTGNSTGPHLHFEIRGARNPF